MKNRAKYLLDNYYDIDNDVIANYEKYSKYNNKYETGTIEYADNLLFLMRCELLLGKSSFISNKIKELLKIYRQHSDLNGEFFALTTYGLSCRDCKNTVEATRILNKAYKISSELNNFNLIVWALINMICIDESSEHSNETLQVFEETKKYVNKIDHLKIIGSYNTNYGFLLYQNGYIQEALKHYNIALDAYTKFYTSDVASNILAAKANIAAANRALGNYDTAIKLYDEVYNAAKQTADEKMVYDCLEGVVKAYEEMNDYKNGFNYLKLLNKKNYELAERATNIENAIKLNAYLSAELEETRDKIVLSNLKLKKQTLELADKVKQLNMIVEMGKQITSTTNESELFEVIIKIIYDNANVHSAGLMLIDEKEKTIHLKYSMEDNKMISTFAKIDFDNSNSFAAYCARENEDIFTNKLKRDASKYIEGYALKTNLSKDKIESGSIIYCRLLTEKRLIGILTLQNKNDDAFNESIFETIKAISSYIAIALSNLKNSRLLEKLSYYDELTGLKNRRSYIEYSKYLAKTPNSYQTIALVIADMNHLKSINDTLGHIEGDNALIKIANILLKSNQTYHLFRLSGDEFAVVMLNINEKTVTDYIKEVQTLCSNENQAKYPLSMAIGYSYADSKADMSRLFIDAETKMYEDKTNYYKNRKINRRAHS